MYAHLTANGTRTAVIEDRKYSLCHSPLLARLTRAKLLLSSLFLSSFLNLTGVSDCNLLALLAFQCHNNQRTKGAGGAQLCFILGGELCHSLIQHGSLPVLFLLQIAVTQICNGHFNFRSCSFPLCTLDSPHLRRLLLPFTSTASVSSLRGERGHRRHRTTFTHGQTLRLEMEYQISEYISRSKRFQLAELLDLTESQIKIWFQNRRAKDKRIEKALNEQQIKQLLPLPNLVAKNVPSSVSSFERASFMGPKAILDPRKE